MLAELFQLKDLLPLKSQNFPQKSGFPETSVFITSVYRTSEGTGRTVGPHSGGRMWTCSGLMFTQNALSTATRVPEP